MQHNFKKVTLEVADKYNSQEANCIKVYTPGQGLDL